MIAYCLFIAFLLGLAALNLFVVGEIWLKIVLWIVIVIGVVIALFLWWLAQFPWSDWR